MLGGLPRRGQRLGGRRDGGPVATRLTARGSGTLREITVLPRAFARFSTCPAGA